MAFSYSNVRNVIDLLDTREKKRLLLVMCAAMFAAVIEVVGVGSIMPFVAVAAQPNLINTNKALNWVYVTFHFSSQQLFLIALGCGMLAFILIRNATNLTLQYIKLRYTNMRRHTLSLKLFKAYLGKSYPFFLNRNSFDFVKNINNEIEQMIQGTLMQIVDILTYSIQILLLAAFLFVLNPLSTLGIAISIVIIYGIIFYAIRQTVKRLGSERYGLNAERNRVVSEAFWGIKEVKIIGIENLFVSSYIAPSKRLSKNMVNQDIISDIPKYVLETVAFGSIIFFILIMIMQSGNFQSVAATVSLYAYAGYRLMPAVQNLFKAFSKLKYSTAGSDLLVKEFNIAMQDSVIPAEAVSRMPFSKSIEIDSISFTYPGIDHPVIQDLSLKIGVNKLIGLAGKTGSGKTTLVDIILGLLEPQSGKMIIDGHTVTHDNVREWQQNIGYVPQNIYLSNDSITANIAFGVPKAEVDFKAVRQAAEMAQIHEFITTELKDGYDTEIGERGIRLSGGQRQRIGIARALYRDPKVLIMDEATSALDNQTELAVMEAIDSLQGSKTIILIAHRLTTLRRCDTIYIMEKGKVIENGTYSELEVKSEYFGKK